jgi:hypothetical protein
MDPPPSGDLCTHRRLSAAPRRLPAARGSPLPPLSSQPSCWSPACKARSPTPPRKQRDSTQQRPGVHSSARWRHCKASRRTRALRRTADESGRGRHERVSHGVGHTRDGPRAALRCPETAVQNLTPRAVARTDDGSRGGRRKKQRNMGHCSRNRPSDLNGWVYSLLCRNVQCALDAEYAAPEASFNVGRAWAVLPCWRAATPPVAICARQHWAINRPRACFKQEASGECAGRFRVAARS